MPLDHHSDRFHGHNSASASHLVHPCHGISTDLEDYFLTRRQFLSRVGMGVGALGLASLVPQSQLLGAPA
ncbi:MAG: twin-arginine translocation signal domain-containing protein, partial [Verrucomicrobia bacterium]|nr:twin-arginine translocation signal domain-containing protein [Verrucomicrobiota bacterium]